MHRAPVPVLHFSHEGGLLFIVGLEAAGALPLQRGQVWALHVRTIISLE